MFIDFKTTNSKLFTSSACSHIHVNYDVLKRYRRSLETSSIVFYKGAGNLPEILRSKKKNIQTNKQNKKPEKNNNNQPNFKSWSLCVCVGGGLRILKNTLILFTSLQFLYTPKQCVGGGDSFKIHFFFIRKKENVCCKKKWRGRHPFAHYEEKCFYKFKLIKIVIQ